MVLQSNSTSFVFHKDDLCEARLFFLLALENTIWNRCQTAFKWTTPL